MRILHFIKGLGRGGAEMLLLHALRHADRERFQYEYAYMLPHKDALVADLREHGAPVHYLPGCSRAELTTAPLRLARLLKERQIDLIHAHLPVAGMVARVAGALTRTPVLYTEHNLNEHYGRLTRIGNRLTWPLNSAVAACSEPVAESIHATMPVWVRVPVRTVINGIDVDQFSDLHGRTQTRRLLGIAADAPVVITVAVFRPQKRLDLWLEAASEISRLLPGARFIVVGDGMLKQEVDSWWRELKLEDTVHLVGLQEDVKPFLAAADVFLLTSDFEGLPLAVIEAMAAGLPVVSTRAGGVPDLVGTGKAAGGRVVDRGDTAACVAGTVELLTNYTMRQEMGGMARARVRHGFGVQGMVTEYEAMYVALGRGLVAGQGKG